MSDDNQLTALHLTETQRDMLMLCRWRPGGKSGVHPRSKLGRQWPLEQWEQLIEMGLLKRWPSGYVRTWDEGTRIVNDWLRGLDSPVVMAALHLGATITEVTYDARG
tara:strand:- start:3100 stop:3420 length:321 start_codon:yes stop_codon:yes gene_type:complete